MKTFLLGAAAAILWWPDSAASGGGESARDTPDSQRSIPVLTLEAASDSDPCDGSPNATSLTAAELMASVLARLPSDPLILEGELTVCRRRGIEVEQWQVRMAAQWGARPPRAVYTLMNRETPSNVELVVTQEPGRAPALVYRVGGVPVPPPGLYEPIGRTDLAWVDLTFSFLWWKPVAAVGSERIRGYRCHVVDLQPPPDAAGSLTGEGGRPLPSLGPSRPYARLRLWVEERLRVVLQAEAYDTRGERIRRVSVESCKKIGDRWMIKDLEFQSSPAIHRTRLTIQNVRSGAMP